MPERAERDWYNEASSQQRATPPVSRTIATDRTPAPTTSTQASAAPAETSRAVSMTAGILALQGDFREHVEMLRTLDHEAVEVRKPAELEALDALIIPGGESTTIARLIQTYGFREPIRAFCASGRAVWGTCAGAILLAKEVDDLDRPGIEVMDISVRRNAFGRQVDSFEADLAIEGDRRRPLSRGVHPRAHHRGGTAAGRGDSDARRRHDRRGAPGQPACHCLPPGADEGRPESTSSS